MFAKEESAELDAKPHTRLRLLEQTYLEAGLSAFQRRQQQLVVQDQIVALRLQRGVDPDMLAAVLAEQLAQDKLASAQDKRRSLT